MRSRTKGLTVNIAIALASTLLSVLAVFVATEMYLASCRSQGIDPPDRLRNSKLIRTAFVDHDYAKLLRAITDQDNDRFKTVWDFDQGISLSRALFIPVEMFGEERYVHRPHVEMCDARVWSEVYFRPLVFSANARISDLLAHCHTSKSVCFPTDAKGFKNDDSSYQAPGPTILFLGDSFTEGLWVSIEDAFPRQFAKLLHQSGISVRALNLGVSGYSAMEMRWILEHFGPSLSPLMVIMNIFLNDVDVHYLRQDIPAANYDRMFADLGKAMEFSEGHGISLYIAIIPAKEQFTWQRNKMIFQKRVKAWCTGRGAKCLDPYEFLNERGGERLYVTGDPHFNEEGHRAYAEFLATELRSEVSAGDRAESPPSPGGAM